MHLDTSEESKQHSKEVLENELGDVKTGSDNMEGKNPGNVAGGLKAYTLPSSHF